MTKIFITEVLIISMLIFNTFAIAKTEGVNQVDLKIVWHVGPLGNLLKELGKEYTKQTGVEIEVELIP